MAHPKSPGLLQPWTRFLIRFLQFFFKLILNFCGFSDRGARRIIRDQKRKIQIATADAKQDKKRKATV